MTKKFTREEFIDAFAKKVTKTKRCWIWIGALDQNGYGKVRFENKSHYAHRICYILFKDSIPEGLHLDHLCRNHACVNPEHLEAVTQKENNWRGVVARRRNMCVSGLHKMTAANTYVNPTTGKTRCRTCRDAYRRKYWLEKHDNRE